MAEIKLGTHMSQRIPGAVSKTYDATDGENRLSLCFFRSADGRSFETSMTVSMGKKGVNAIYPTDREIDGGDCTYFEDERAFGLSHINLFFTGEHEKQFFLTAMRMLLDVCENKD